jgi:hypothetical protein
MHRGRTGPPSGGSGPASGAALGLPVSGNGRMSGATWASPSGDGSAVGAREGPRRPYLDGGGPAGGGTGVGDCAGPLSAVDLWCGDIGVPPPTAMVRA